MKRWENIALLLLPIVCVGQEYSVDNRLFERTISLKDSQQNEYIATTDIYFFYQRPKYNELEATTRNSENSLRRPSDSYTFIEGKYSDFCGVILEGLNDGFNVYDTGILLNLDGISDMFLGTVFNVEMQRLNLYDVAEASSSFRFDRDVTQIDYAVIDIENNGEKETVYLRTLKSPIVAHSLEYIGGVIDDPQRYSSMQEYREALFSKIEATPVQAADLRNYPDFLRKISELDRTGPTISYGSLNQSITTSSRSPFFYKFIFYNNKYYVLQMSAGYYKHIIDVNLVEYFESAEPQIICRYRNKYISLLRDDFESL